LSEENSKSQAPPDLKIGPNKSQISISNDQNTHRSRIASFRKPGSLPVMIYLGTTVKELFFWNFEFGSLGFV
jgi:hypothetical protein